MTNRMIDYWVIPPECDAEFVACMEEVLETQQPPRTFWRKVFEFSTGQKLHPSELMSREYVCSLTDLKSTRSTSEGFSNKF